MKILSERGPDHTKPLILTIDDDSSIRVSIRNFLEDYEYRVLEAENGRIGVEVFERENPDLVLVDLRMREMGGLDVLSRISSLSPDTPLVVVSGTGVIGDAVEALHQGAWDYLLKPIEDMSVLLHAVEKSLERANLIRENRRYQQHLEEEVLRRTNELMHTNLELRDSEERFRTVIDASRDAMISIDQKGIIDIFNPAAERIFGRSQDEMVGNELHNLIPEEYREQLQQHMSRFFMSNDSHSLDDGMVDVPALRKDGSVFPAEVSLSSGTLGNDILVFAIIRDGTERKQSELSIKRLATAIEQCVESIIVFDPNGIILYVNPAFEMITGFSSEEAVGSSFELIECNEQDEYVLSMMRDAIKYEKSWSGILTIQKKDGSILQTETTISPVRDSAGKITSFVSVQRDVTLENQLETQLRQAQKMEAIGQLAGGVAHDFNNLLQVIMGYGEIAQMCLPVEDQARQNLDKVMHAAQSASNLVRQLLTFSRRDAMQPATMNLNTSISDLMKMIRRVIGEHIELKIIPDQDLGTLYADPGQIEQVLMNLCVNARDAMPQGGVITIETSMVSLDSEYCHQNPWAEEGYYALLAISDSGEGIPSDVQDHIFEPFFTTKEADKGTGLGLATVYGIVKQHDGFIHLQSKIDEGTCFRVFLPCQKGVASPEGETVENSEFEGGNEVILLAEDEEQVRQLAVTVLERAGYRVLVARDGEEAMHMFRSHKVEIDLALLDMVMPKKSGQMVFNYIRITRPDIPVLFCSGYSFTAQQDLMTENGVQLIQKPFSPKELLCKVRESFE
jgi:PAS domain S-box-containing protein